MVNVREVVFIVIAVSSALLYWFKPVNIVKTETKEVEVHKCDKLEDEQLRAACVASDICTQSNKSVANFELKYENYKWVPKFSCQ